MANGEKAKHIVFLRNPDEAPAWGGLEKLMMEWFERIDYSSVRVTLAVSKSWVDTFSQKIKAIDKPVNVVELPWESGRVGFFKRFWDVGRFLGKLKLSTVVFIQGWAFSFDLASVMAGFFVAGGEVYMHENLGSPPPLPKTSRLYGGFIPGLGLWWFTAKLSVMLRAYFSRKIIAVSRKVKENLTAYWSYPEGKVVVRHHGVDLNRFQPSADVRRKMRDTMKIAQDEKVIIAASHLTKVKCVDRVIEAFDAVSRESGPVTLIVIGKGPLENELKALAQSKVGTTKIMFLGHINDIADYLKMSDIYVLASDNEGFSIGLLEAMASGLICVATNCPGTDELIQDGSNGFLAEKNTESVVGSLKRALALSEEDGKKVRAAAVRFINENFELNKKVRDALGVMGLAYSGNGEIVTSK